MAAKLKPSLRLRIASVALIGAVAVLVDEAVKEGYILDPTDLFNPAITHEKIFLSLLIVGLVAGWRRAR